MIRYLSNFIRRNYADDRLSNLTDFFVSFSLFSFACEGGPPGIGPINPRMNPPRGPSIGGPIPGAYGPGMRGPPPGKRFYSFVYSQWLLAIKLNTF